MTPEELDRILRILSHQRPFRPFLIEFVSGDRVEVPHPEAVSLWDRFYLYVSPHRERRCFVPGSVCQILLTLPPQ